MKLMYRRHAEEKGYVINNVAAGRPRAYKGSTFNPSEVAPLYTKVEEKLIELLHEVKMYANLPRDVRDRVNYELDHLTD